MCVQKSIVSIWVSAVCFQASSGTLEQFPCGPEGCCVLRMLFLSCRIHPACSVFCKHSFTSSDIISS